MSQLECRPLGLQVTRWWCARMNCRHGHIVAQCDIGPDEALHSELKVAAPASSTAGLPDRVSILGTTSTHTHTRAPYQVLLGQSGSFPSHFPYLFTYKPLPLFI